MRLRFSSVSEDIGNIPFYWMPVCQKNKAGHWESKLDMDKMLARFDETAAYKLLQSYNKKKYGSIFNNLSMIGDVLFLWLRNEQSSYFNETISDSETNPNEDGFMEVEIRFQDEKLESFSDIPARSDYYVRACIRAPQYVSFYRDITSAYFWTDLENVRNFFATASFSGVYVQCDDSGVPTAATMYSFGADSPEGSKALRSWRVELNEAGAEKLFHQIVNVRLVDFGIEDKVFLPDI